MDEIKVLVCLDKGGVACVRGDHPDIEVEVFDMVKKRRDGYTHEEIEADWDMVVQRYPNAAED